MFDRLASGLWWDIGLNLVEGCTKVSPGCNNCRSLAGSHRKSHQANLKLQARYAGVLKYRRTAPDRTDTARHFEGPPEWSGRVNPQWDDLDKIGRARTSKCYVFWNDLFHEGVPEEFISAALCHMLAHPQHFYIICTKRPQRALDYFNLCYRDFLNLPEITPASFQRIMIMTSVENQEMADLRLPVLLRIPGVLHGVNYEPALGPVDFTRIKWAEIPIDPANYRRFGVPVPTEMWSTNNVLKSRPADKWNPAKIALDWLLCGGETGPGARPSHPDWLRQARDQATAAGVPFFFKSWGKWTPFNSWESACHQIGWGLRKDLRVLWPNGIAGSAVIGGTEETWDRGLRAFYSLRGQNFFSRLLDGREWNEVPDVC